MKWLITGGCGFIGSNLADQILNSGGEVALFDNLSRFGSAENLAWLRSRHGDGLRHFQHDIRDTVAVSAAIAEIKPGVVAHLAGQVAATTSLENPRMDFEINAGGTLNLLEAVRAHSPSSIVLYSSTNKVYGSLERLTYVESELRYDPRDYPNGLDESIPLDGSTPYGCSKLSAEQYVRDYYRIYGISTVVFRHSSMYGGRQFATFDQGWVGWFCQQGLGQQHQPDREPFTIAGNGKQVRDLLHADDLIRCYTNAVDHIETSKGQIYNIGGGVKNSMSLLELFRLVGGQLGITMRFRETPVRIADQKYYVADTGKASRELDWQVRISQEEGVDRMLQWCRQAMERAR